VGIKDLRRDSLRSAVAVVPQVRTRLGGLPGSHCEAAVPVRAGSAPFATSCYCPALLSTLFNVASPPPRQDTVLFNDTIMANIRYANPEASDDQVMEAARLAHLHGEAHAGVARRPAGASGVSKSPVRRPPHP
jgi:hypothetical protein